MSGPSYTQFGDVVSSCLEYSEAPSAVKDLNQNFSVCLGQIVEVYPAGSAKVEDKKLARFVLFDVKIMHPNLAQEIIPFCRMLQPGFGGGLNNYLEVIPTDPGPKAKSKSSSMEDVRGHWVLVAFISGKKNTGVILGAMPHGNKVAASTRPKQEEGTHLEGEVQGLNFQITNDGALNIKFQGPKKDDGTLVNSEVGPTDIQIDKNGNISISTNAKQSVSIDRTTKTITISNGDTFIKMDQDANKVQVVANTVEVGKESLQPQVVGDDLVDWLSKLSDAISQIVVPTGVGPSGTPVNAPAFKQLASQLKTKILSKKHKVEK
jgi:hypothetical protein